MTQPCMLAYSLLLIKTCHRRGVHAMGGMAAQIPIKNDPAANAAALEKVLTNSASRLGAIFSIASGCRSSGSALVAAVPAGLPCWT